MSVDDRLRAGLREAAATPVVDTTAALVEVENMDQKVKTRRGVLLAAAAAAAVVAGLVWGPGLLDSLGGETDTAVAGSPEDPAAVLAAYEDARNARDYDALRALVADDAVITGHPLDYSDPPIADVDEFVSLERGVFSNAETWLVEVEVSGNQATFTQLFSVDGDCHSTPGDQVTVEDGKITSYTWVETRGEQACTPEQLAEAGVEE